MDLRNIKSGEILNLSGKGDRSENVLKDVSILVI